MTNADDSRATEPQDTAAGPGPGAPVARRSSAVRTIGLVALATLAGAVVGAFALYGMNRLPGNAPQAQSAASAGPAVAAADPACAGTVDRVRAFSSLAKGDLAALAIATEPRRLPPLTFTDAAGQPVSLADFKGRVVLLNLWATWCVPCRKEMPALDHLEKSLGGADFAVVAVNLDTRDPEKPRAFLSEIGVSSLAYYADPQTKTFQALRSVGRGFGLPTTLLIDRDGCEMGYLAGPAEWGGADAQALVKAAIGASRAEASPPR